jgi:hypothetical protein
LVQVPTANARPHVADLLIERYLPEFERTYDERYARRYGSWRPIIGQVARKFLRCGDLHFGFARVRCPDCRHEMFVAFSCRRLLAAWQTKVFEFLLAAGKTDQPTLDQMRCWSHSGFSVDNSVDLSPRDTAGYGAKDRASRKKGRKSENRAKNPDQNISNSREHPRPRGVDGKEF